MAEESVFLSYVRYILKTWNGFQAAIDSGMGGPYVKEKEDWLAVEVENYFKQYEGDVVSDEIEDYIDKILHVEFKTSCEDGSLKNVSDKFCKAYELSLKNPDEEMFNDMRKYKASFFKENQSSMPQEKPKEETTPVSSVDENMGELHVDDEDEGWTVVANKHKKQIGS